MDRLELAYVMAEIADTASETLDLQQVFDRMVASIRQLIPFDEMGVVRVLDGVWGVVHATTVHAKEARRSSKPTPLTDWSPRVRPRAGPVPRIDDAPAELDPTFPIDAEIIARGMRSLLWEPFRSQRTELTGGIWLSAYHPRAFVDAHQELLAPIAALLGSTVGHWRIWDAERRRRQRLGQLENLFETLAGTLDVGDVFDEISAAIQSALPHDKLFLTEHDSRVRTFRVVAHAGDPTVSSPRGAVPLTQEETQQRLLDYEIIRDLPAELTAATERNRALLATGMRSWLRVPVRLWGEVWGVLSFMHREPARLEVDHVEVAQRLADRVALALSHRRLAEEERIAAEACERARRLEVRVEHLKRELGSREQIRVVGNSRPWREVLGHVGRVAASETNVLITGESGTGKEVVSRLVHEGSARADGPFAAINCAALPEQLLESELFGHQKGAFTGALAAKAGRIEQAAGGTLFLDEIGETSPLVQAKLLRVLQEREFQRLGGTRSLAADVRLVAATNRDLAAAIEQGQFREDLYYRVAVFEIHVPPLRERPEDILLLAESFLAELGSTMGRPAAGFSREARDWLLDYPWPGNIRELKNAIERAILLCDGGLITRHHLPAAAGRPGDTRPLSPASDEALLDPLAPLPAGGVDLEEVERGFVKRALRQTRGNKSRASRLLGLTRAQLYSRLDKYGLR